MESKKIELDGVSFILNPLRPRQALKITKNLVQLIGSGAKVGGEAQLMTAVATGLQSMEDDDFEVLCLTMLATTQVVLQSGSIEITTPEAFDLAFADVNLENLFVLLYEVLVYNRFPLVRDLDLDIGSLIQGIELSLKEENFPETEEKSMEIPESSTTKS